MRCELPGIRPWRHELGHCLHATMGVLLGHHGLDPLLVLGPAWGFGYSRDDLRREEYYFPLGAVSLLGALAPYHPVSSRWHEPAHAVAGWAQVRAAVTAGHPVAVAADNYYLPFRPAYRDVHTNHLLTVYGYDDERGEVLVADPVPPRFQGAIGIDQLTSARDSANPVRHGRDMFFTRNPIGNRWLEIAVGSGMPPWNLEFVRSAVERNLDGLLAGARTSYGTYAGLAGQARFLAEVADRMAASCDDVVDEAFLVAGAVLAATGVHAGWLAAAGRSFGRPALAEAGRAVDRVAHHWTALRIQIAAARGDSAAAAQAVRARTASLISDQQRAMRLLERA